MHILKLFEDRQTIIEARTYTAIVIKGNPKYLKEQKALANRFYKEIKQILEESGFRVSFDPGEPYTSPDKADLWVCHSRGCDRVRWADTGQHVIKLGSPDDDALIYPGDIAKEWDKIENYRPVEEHYKVPPQFTQRVKEIRAELDKI